MYPRNLTHTLNLKHTHFPSAEHFEIEYVVPRLRSEYYQLALQSPSAIVQYSYIVQKGSPHNTTLHDYSNMALFSGNNESRLGTLNTVPFFLLPKIPTFVSEWAGIFPLVVHLAGHRDDYKTAGNVALMGRLSISMFPKLGALAGISRLLERTQEFLDQASTRGGSSSTVWDVRWGSVFPCANGAASSVIMRYVRARHIDPAILMPERVALSDPSTSEGEISIEPRVDRSALKASVPTHFRRHQMLHVYRFGHKSPKKSPTRKWAQLRMSLPGRITIFCFCLGVAGVLILCGAYGKKWPGSNPLV